jgi:hypothetical protein
MPKGQIVGNIDIRGNRILLPEYVTGMSRLIENDEVLIKAANGKIEIEKVK